MTDSLIPEDRTDESIVLIVDDEPSLVRAVSRLLRAMKFKVLIATSGREAVETCQACADEIDIVLLDRFLSGVSCLETVRQLRSLCPGIKVILTSGHDRKESLAQFADLHLDGFLMKPYGYMELENAIKAALAHTPRTPNE